MSSAVRLLRQQWERSCERLLSRLVGLTDDEYRWEAPAVVPGQQVSLPPTTIYERGNATLTFVPTEGAPIEEFEQGSHTVTVIYWKILESRAKSLSYTWTFSVF